MSAATYIDDARAKAADLHRWTSRGSGDTLSALRRLALQIGVPYAKLWALRYRPPRDIGAAIYDAILEAHARELARQAKRFAAEHARTAPRTALGRSLHGTAARLAGESAAALSDAGPEGRR